MSHRDAATEHKVRMRWGRISAVLAVLIATGYVIVCAVAPIPGPVLELTVEPERITAADTADVQALVDGQGAPTAVGWLDGDEVWVNSEDAVPIASISKIVTVLVALEAQPIEPGSDGRTHVWSKEDALRQAEYLAADGIVFPVPVGTEMTERQMLTLALLPSANDFAAAYANSVFGSDEAFVAAVEDWKRAHGFDSLTIVEPTGMDGSNAANPGDLVRIARLALADPTIAEIARMRSAELPWGIGEVQNTNPLLRSLPDTVGLKTGFSTAAGYALLAAQEGEARVDETEEDGAEPEADGEPREVVKIAVTLDRPTSEARAAETRDALLALDGAAQRVEPVEADEVVGEATTIDEIRIPLIAESSSSTILLPGESATRMIELQPVEAGPRGQVAGVIGIVGPEGAATVPIVTDAAIVEPDFWWRLTRPHRLFGSA